MTPSGAPPHKEGASEEGAPPFEEAASWMITLEDKVPQRTGLIKMTPEIYVFLAP